MTDIPEQPTEPTAEPETRRALSALQEDPSLAEREGIPPDSGPEQRVMKLHRAMFRAAPIRFCLAVGAIPAGLGLAAWLLWIREDPITWAATLSGLVSFGAVVWLVWWKILCLGYTLEITNKRTIRRVGLLSKDTSEVLHDNIRNFQLRQGLWERVWDVGTIGIASAGQEGIEISMDKVPRPAEIRRIIDLYRPLG